MFKATVTIEFIVQFMNDELRSGWVKAFVKVELRPLPENKEKPRSDASPLGRV
jgi:hypothetical protein